MKLFKSFLPLLMLISFSCSNKTTEEIDQLYDALVKGHDEVMPKSMAIPAVLEKMNKALETASEEKKTQASDIAARLHKAEEEMNEWMVAFGEAINAEMDDPARLETYTRLHADIVRLKDETDLAISDAKNITN